MGGETREKLIRELRGRVEDLSAAVQLLTPLVCDTEDEKARGYLASLNKSLYRLIRTVSHLDMSREEIQPCLQTIDAAGLCREICREVDGLVEDLGVEFQWSEGTKSVLVPGDSALLQRALLSILSNALSAAGRGGKVRMHWAVRGSRFSITVSDSGRGLKMPAEEENIFLKNQEGLGLGLSCARNIAAAHGGVLVLENSENDGVRAVLSLPVGKQNGNDEVHQSMGVDRTGGFSAVLVEFSPLLPRERFFPEDLE